MNFRCRCSSTCESPRANDGPTIGNVAACPDCGVDRLWTRRRLLGATGAALTLGGSVSDPAAAQTTDPARAAFLDFFDKLALQKPPYLGVPTWVRKWAAVPQVWLDGDDIEPLRARAAGALIRLAEWSGLSLELAPEKPSTSAPAIVISMIEPGPNDGRPSPWRTACHTTSDGQNGALRRAYVRINAAFPDCLEHELLHALGLDNHWLAGPESEIWSVLAMRDGARRARSFSPWDAAAVRLLYDPLFAPGLPREAALVTAAHIVAGWRRAI